MKASTKYWSRYGDRKQQNVQWRVSCCLLPSSFSPIEITIIANDKKYCMFDIELTKEEAAKLAESLLDYAHRK